ncbi:MAG: pyruvate kinase, partial [Rhodospirillales bacterium]
MIRNRSTKIVATLGPSSSTRERIAALMLAGVDVFRLNFSHGTHEDHKNRFTIIRSLEAELGHPSGIMLDLQGPKLRVGQFADGNVDLKKGQAFHLDLSDSLGDATRVQLPHPEIF